LVDAVDGEDFDPAAATGAADFVGASDAEAAGFDVAASGPEALHQGFVVEAHVYLWRKIFLGA
jgi:hypothetical protein